MVDKTPSGDNPYEVDEPRSIGQLLAKEWIYLADAIRFLAPIMTKYLQSLEEEDMEMAFGSYTHGIYAFSNLLEDGTYPGLDHLKDEIYAIPETLTCVDQDGTEQVLTLGGIIKSYHESK